MVNQAAAFDHVALTTMKAICYFNLTVFKFDAAVSAIGLTYFAGYTVGCFSENLFEKS